MNIFKVEYGAIPEANILGIPARKLDEIKADHHSTDEQEVAVVRYWLLRDPLASWRRIIYQLDVWAGFVGYRHYSDIADRIRHYAEELTGMCFFIKPLIQYYPCIARD